MSVAASRLTTEWASTTRRRGSGWRMCPTWPSCRHCAARRRVARQPGIAWTHWITPRRPGGSHGSTCSRAPAGPRDRGPRRRRRQEPPDVHEYAMHQTYAQDRLGSTARALAPRRRASIARRLFADAHVRRRRLVGEQRCAARRALYVPSIAELYGCSRARCREPRSHRANMANFGLYSVAAAFFLAEKRCARFSPRHEAPIDAFFVIIGDGGGEHGAF